MASRPAVLLTTRSGRVRAARRLARRRSREEHRLFLAEGDKAVSEALAVPGCLVEVFASQRATVAHAALREAVEAVGLSWHECEDDAVGTLAGTVTPQGLVGVCRFLDVDEERLAAAAGADAGPLAVCADVRDPGNAGTVIRTADATGAAGVLLAGDSVDPYNPKTVRATVGSLFHVPLARSGDPAALVDRLRARGLTVLAADGRGETGLFDAGAAGLLSGRVAWLFGNEARGLPDGLAARCDHRVAIPIPGRAESLNLAAAAAVCLYETMRVRS